MPHNFRHAQSCRSNSEQTTYATIDTEQRFNSDTDNVVQQLDTRIRLYTDVQVTMQELFGASDQVSRDEFRDFVKGLNLPERYPGFQTLNYAPYVPAAELASFVANQRKDLVLRDAGVEFAVRPAGQRPDYFLLTYVGTAWGQLAVNRCRYGCRTTPAQSTRERARHGPRRQ
ncbi:hypothetical protein AWV80_27905 [Cupriavidus sp. UYMU48A]|nr:hypothetical protein AWV80_27905 [Cupriavidus sp. UYMU48A]